MNIDELKRLAEAATPGPWFCDPFKWAETIVCGAGEEIDHVFIGGPICETRNPLGIPGADPRCEQMRKANSRYIAAANPTAVLELIAEVDRQRGYADDLTIALESSEKQLKDSRANDYTAMGYLADCRMAVGDNGKRMLPEFVEYLRQLRQQRDELLAALSIFMEVVDRPPKANCSCHLSPPCNDCVENFGLREAFSFADAAIANAEKQS